MSPPLVRYVIAGLVIALFAAFLDSTSVLPWVVGGTGLLTGFVGWRRAARETLLLSVVLVVALSAIREQPFNPFWLTDVVLFVRVFFAHVALAAGLLRLLAPREQPA